MRTEIAYAILISADFSHETATLIRTTPELSTFASLLPSSVLDYISTAPHLTLFLPTNDAWSALTELEMRYLRSGFADNDLSEIFGDAASQSGAGKGKVGYLERLVGEKADGKTQLETIRNGTLEVQGEGDATKATVNGTAIERGDILAKNGTLATDFDPFRPFADRCPQASFTWSRPSFSPPARSCLPPKST